jgi:hypothetical protein
MDGKVGGGVMSRGDKDRIPLGDREREREDWELCNVGPVNLGVIGSKHNHGKRITNFDHTHIVAVDPEDELGKCRSVDHTQTIGFPWLEGEGGVHIEADG